MVKLPRIQKEITACLQCGYCIDVCEAHNQTPWESVTPRGKIYYITQLDKVGTGAEDKLLGRDIQLSPEFVDAMYKCTGCGNCEVVCHAKIHLVDLWEKMRDWIVANGAGPLPAHRGIAGNIANKHNSFGEDPKKRDAWWPAEIERSATPDVVFFAGCTGSYRMQHIAKAGVTVLARAGIKMNCLGEKEYCCSSPLLRTGNPNLSLMCAEAVVEKADGIGAKDMVMTCSGCYKTVSSDFGRFYAKVGQNVYHFSQYVERLINERKLPLNNEFKAKVTYHDPCHLGRHCGVYEAPREVIAKIPGVDFREMEYNRKTSHCCGGGGGVRSAFPEESMDIAGTRLDEAAFADIIITTCPFCVNNLDSAKGDRDIQVRDLVEVIDELM